MFRIGQVILFFLMLLLLNFEFLFLKPAFAEEAQSIMRDTKATNPNCQLSKAVATAVGVALVATIALFFAAKILNFIPIIGSAVAILSVVAGITALTLAVMGYPAYFACYWSFVRHPVMRFDKNDKDGGVEGKYKECENPSRPYPTCANKEFRSEEEYFKCIGNNNVEDGKKNEPMCPEKKYKSVNDYYWPKNRVSNSNYIEFCYRLPLGLGLLPPVLLVYILDTELGKGGLDGAFLDGRTGVDGSTKLRIREGEYGGGDIKRGKAYIRGPVECEILKANQKAKAHSITFKAVERSDKICVDAVKSELLTLWPQPEVGCHMRPSGPPAPMCANSKAIFDPEGSTNLVGYNNNGCFSCYIAPACRGSVGSYVQSPFPVTSVIVSCIKESLNNLLIGHCEGQDTPGEGFLPVAQKKLKNAVTAALILALILFAIKAALGGVQNTSEVYILGLKFALVLYFTSGDAMSHYYDQVIKLSIGLSDIVLQAGGNDTICNYGPNDYVGAAKKYAYVAPWDRLDCRMMFYFGSQLNGTTGGTILFTLLGGALLIVAVLFNAQVLICLAALFAVLMIIFIVIWMVYLFILSLIALTILALISPLMIPMVLFQATKGFFDGWVKQGTI